MAMNKLSLALTVFVFSLLLVQTVFAYQYYLRPPRMTLYTNVTRTTPGTFEGFLEIRNYNNITMNVSFSVSGDLQNITTLQYPFVVLQPQEKIIWNFTGEVDKVGIYKGRISALYGLADFRYVNLDSDIIVVASGEDVQRFPVDPTVAIVAALIALAVLGFILLRKKPRKK